MKQVFDVRCDYCGSPFTVKMHKAAFKRCTGPAVCSRQECRNKNTAAILEKIEKIERIEPISSNHENGMLIGMCKSCDSYYGHSLINGECWDCRHPKPARELEAMGKLPAFGIRRVIWGS